MFVRNLSEMRKNCPKINRSKLLRPKLLASNVLILALFVLFQNFLELT